MELATKSKALEFVDSIISYIERKGEFAKGMNKKI